jgi:hypothetical protein
VIIKVTLCIEQKYQNITQVGYRAFTGGMAILFPVPASEGSARYGCLAGAH